MNPRNQPPQPKVRLTGLTALIRRLRSQLEGGTPHQVRWARAQAGRLLAQIEQKFSSQGIDPANLTPASARAYQELKIYQAGEPEKPSNKPWKAQKLRFSGGGIAGLTGPIDQIQAALAGVSAAGGETGQILIGISHLVAEVDALCQAAGVKVHELNPPSWRAYAWLLYLSEAGSLERHRSALERFRRAEESLKRRNKIRIQAIFCNQTAIYRYRVHPKEIIVQISEGFIDAPPDVMRSLAMIASGSRSRAARRLVWAYSISSQYLSISRLLAGTASIRDLDGEEKRLEEMFTRLNAVYFRGELPRPRLTWSTRSNRRVLGTYAPASDTIMLSRGLLSPEIPGYVVEFVLYHEMLHKALGTTLSGGKRRSHTTEFNRLEEQFPDFSRAQAWLIGNCRGRIE